MKAVIVVPTLNEEKAIGKVVESFKKKGYDVLVVDGRSTDRTREIAEEKGAKVIVQSGKGKGQALAEAFQLIDEDIAVVVDGDGSYLAEDVEKLIEPIEKGLSDHVIGNRFSNFEAGAFTKLNLIGNKILNFFFRFFYGVDLKDILSGYRALRKEVYKNLELKKAGFEVEVEITVETLAKGFRISEVPISYKKREGRTKLKPIKDGLKIGVTIYRLLAKYSPARYLYFAGLIFLLLGLLFGIYVVYEWFLGISHFLLAILTALLVISGLQMLTFGLVMDFLLKTYHELRREMRRYDR
ncbi:MAG: S-layer glycoprotein N-glycosyltransferase AglJ [Archaeoglobaceae archaeon]|nr:S-layer glycoprotein N-glycosyltransferase AglJ [Archaeoglobaceae archaeon]MCX8152541.1 S-layer glycoprotein N-glycosyltransferase AglJ [Archaeoglobaceae archaeon]MDW8014038.1 S-layer glycoprotein N-glycosyltransferase AglJ [Archaeoglobaceae archaeon]